MRLAGKVDDIDKWTADDFADMALAALAEGFDPRRVKGTENGERRTENEKRDAEYMAAVERGDMETAQRMVNEAAKSAMPDTKVVDENGMPLVVYHGAYDGGYTVFDKSKRGTATNAKSAKKGFFFTESKKWGEEWARRSANGELYEVYLNMKNPLVVDFEGKSVNADAELNKLINQAKREGYDGVIAKNLKDGFEVHNQYVAFEPEQIKSADPVTYDDAGNVIPLSKRFNKRKADIRYQFAGERGATAADKAEETEDVAREDQVFLFGNGGERAMSNEEDNIANRIAQTTPINIGEPSALDSESKAVYDIFKNKGEGWRKKVIEWAIGKLPKSTQTSFGNVEYHPAKIRGALSHGFGDLKMLTLPYLDEMFKNGVLYDSHKEGDFTYYNVAHRLSYQGDDYIARLVAREDQNGNLFYDHEFTDIKKIGAPATGREGTENSTTSPLQLFAKVRQKIKTAKNNLQDAENKEIPKPARWQNKQEMERRRDEIVDLLHQRGFDNVYTSKSTANGTSYYINVYSNDLSRKLAKIRLSDHSVTNYSRLTEEYHVSPNDSAEKVVNDLFGDNDGIMFRKETDEETIERLEREPKVKVYRAMQVIDGELYPPMSAMVNGELREPTKMGVWERADENPELADENGRFKLDKGNRKSLKAAYNPYIHTSATMLNDQFSEAQSRPNLVVVECEVPESELTSGYRAEKAKDSVGKKQWKAGVIQGQLSGTREVILSRWAKL